MSSGRDVSRLIVVCGLAAEAKIAAGSGVSSEDVTVIAGGGDAGKLAAAIEAAAPRAQGILSFGVAGGLSPKLAPGDLLVADCIVAPDGTRRDTDVVWRRKIASKLGTLAKSAPWLAFAGVDQPLADVAGKAALFRASGAATVDMESHIVAEAAARHGLALAAIRVVTDPAGRALPHAATVGMRADGQVDLPAILRSLARSPGQLPGLIRTGLDARLAFAALLRCRQLLGRGFTLFDL